MTLEVVKVQESDLVDLSFLTRLPGIDIRGEMFNSKDPAVLSQDMLEIDLPSGKWIEVGWEPDEDPQGAYCIRLFQEQVFTPAIEELTTTNIFEVIAIIASLISRY